MVRPFPGFVFPQVGQIIIKQIEKIRADWNECSKGNNRGGRELGKDSLEKSVEIKGI